MRFAYQYKVVTEHDIMYFDTLIAALCMYKAHEQVTVYRRLGYCCWGVIAQSELDSAVSMLLVEGMSN